MSFPLNSSFGTAPKWINEKFQLHLSPFVLTTGNGLAKYPPFSEGEDMVAITSIQAPFLDRRRLSELPIGKGKVQRCLIEPIVKMAVHGLSARILILGSSDRFCFSCSRIKVIRVVKF